MSQEHCPVCQYLAEQEQLHKGRRDKAEAIMRNEEYGTPDRVRYERVADGHASNLYAVWALQVDHERLCHPSV